MFDVQNFFHTSPAFTLVPAGSSAPGPMNAPAAIQQPSPIPIGLVIKSKVSLEKSWLPVHRKDCWEMHPHTVAIFLHLLVLTSQCQPDRWG